MLSSRDPMLSPRHQDEQLFATTSEELAHVEEMLDDCLEALSHYTGETLLWPEVLRSMGIYVQMW